MWWNLIFVVGLILVLLQLAAINRNLSASGFHLSEIGVKQTELLVLLKRYEHEIGRNDGKFETLTTLLEEIDTVLHERLPLEPDSDEN